LFNSSAVAFIEFLCVAGTATLAGFAIPVMLLIPFILSTFWSELGSYRVGGLRPLVFYLVSSLGFEGWEIAYK